MRQVFLPIGPRGVGKSTFSRLYKLHHPKAHLINRDKLLQQFYGPAWTNPYMGLIHEGVERILKIIEQNLRRSCVTIVFDCYTQSNQERRILISRLREHGADKVHAWRFITPAELGAQWFFQRESITPNAFQLKSYAITHKVLMQCNTTEDQDFDSVQEINPLQKLLFFPF